MWIDTTSYSRDDKVQKQTTWTTQNENLSITVTCGHILYRPDWVMHCHALGIDTLRLLECRSPGEARAKAIRIVRAKLSRLAEEATQLTSE